VCRRDCVSMLRKLLISRLLHLALPEFEALPSVVFFVECLLSGTRQRRLCRVPHSVKLGSRQRAPLPSAKHSAQVGTRQRSLCRCTVCRAFFAECYTRQSLCRVFLRLRRVLPALGEEVDSGSVALCFYTTAAAAQACDKQMLLSVES
jgi:hypothetical protein